MSKFLASLSSYAIFSILFNNHCNANTITCTSPGDNCHHTEINCLPNEDCNLICDGIQSCLESTINCPINGDCNIFCRGGQSCRYSTINATNSNGNFNLTCMDSTDHCRDMKIYGSTVQTLNNSDFNIRCNGKYRACMDSEIICPAYSDCNIKCDTDNSCRYTDIQGPLEGDLTVDCDGPKSCFDAIIDGKDSWKLDIYGCTEDKSCLDLTIYCPPHSNGSTNCFIQGNDNLGRDNAGGTRIYAINGWKDIDIDYSGTFLYSRHGGFMHCGDNLNQTCNIDTYSWLCSDPGHYCNDVDATPNPTTNPTLQPTIQPSVYPTTQPTTSEPTFRPTMNPTTYAPTVRLAIGRVSTEPTITITNNQTANSGIAEIVDVADINRTPGFDQTLVYILSTVAILSLIIAMIVFVKVKGFCVTPLSKDKHKEEVSNSMDGAEDIYPNMIHHSNIHNLNIRKLPQGFKRNTFSAKMQPGSPIAITDEEEDSNTTTTNTEEERSRDPSSDDIITEQATKVAHAQTEGLLHAVSMKKMKHSSSGDPLDSSGNNSGDNSGDNGQVLVSRRSRVSESGNRSRKESYLSAAISDITSIQHSYNYNHVGGYNPNSVMTDYCNEALVNDNNENPKAIYSNLNGDDSVGHKRGLSDNVSIHSNEFIVKSDSNQSKTTGFVDKTPAPPPRKKNIESNGKRNEDVDKLRIDLSGLQAMNDKDIRDSESDSEMYRVMPKIAETPTTVSSGRAVDHV